MIAREIPTTAEGQTLEVLVGWERLEAFTHKDAFPRAPFPWPPSTHKDAFPRAPSVPLATIDCNSADGAFYAIEYASLDQKATGLITSPLLYATAAQAAIEHFSQPEQPWSIQDLAAYKKHKAHHPGSRSRPPLNAVYEPLPHQNQPIPPLILCSLPCFPLFSAQFLPAGQ